MQPRHDDRQGIPHGRFQRAIHARLVRNAEMAAREGQQSLKERPLTPSRACPAGMAGPTTEANRPMVHGTAVLRDSYDPLRSNFPTGLFSPRELSPG